MAIFDEQYIRLFNEKLDMYGVSANFISKRQGTVTPVPFQLKVLPSQEMRETELSGNNNIIMKIRILIIDAINCVSFLDNSTKFPYKNLKLIETVTVMNNTYSIKDVSVNSFNNLLIIDLVRSM